MGNMNLTEPQVRESSRFTPAMRREELDDIDNNVDNLTVDNINEEISSDNVFSSERNNDVVPEKVSRIRKLRDKVGALVNNDIVQKIIISLIGVNSVLMGIGTFDFVTDNPTLNTAFNLADKVFLIIFTIELCMQIIYHGFNLFLDGWLIFDFFIVIFSWVFNSMQGIRAFRIFRALRLVTRFKTMRNLVEALLSVVPRMLAIAALLMLIFYIFAVMFTDLFMGVTNEENPAEECSSYFTSLDGTLFTLFQIMTLEWAFIARSCMTIYSWAWIPFVIFVMITSFIVFNLIIAVICDAVAVLHDQGEAEMREDPEEELQKRVRELAINAKLLMESQERIQHALDTLSKSVHYKRSTQENSSITSALKSASDKSGF